MGKISGGNLGQFKSAEYIYAKIKRELKSFGSVNLIDDADFPLYTAEVLKRLGVSAYREEEALLFVKNGKATLPRDFKQLYAAYKCKCSSVKKTHILNSVVVYQDTYHDILTTATTGCTFECEGGSLLQRITIRTLMDSVDCTYTYMNPGLLRLSPNVKPQCAENCLNLMVSSPYEITINNGCIYTNFKDEDIYMKYYAFPFDADGNIMIPDVLEVEKAVEWYIKKELLLNYWLVDDITNIQNKWQKAEEEFNKWFGEAKFVGKLPAFNTLLDSARTKRATNIVNFMSQQDRFNR